MSFHEKIFCHTAENSQTKRHSPVACPKNKTALDPFSHAVRISSLNCMEITRRIPQIAIPVRHTYSASDAGVCASFFDGQTFAVSPFFRVHMVDCGGSEDAFSAGLIYALHQNFDTQTSVNYAAASNAMKHTIINDINFSTVEEIVHLCGSGERDFIRD